MARIFFFLLLMAALINISSRAFAADASFTQEDRERLIALEVTMREFKESVDKRFVDLREDMNKRFEQVDKRFEQMFTFLWMITGIFTTLTLGVIGFAYWDRRTIIRTAKEEAVAEIEKEGKVRNLINALRELSRSDAEVAKVLKQFNLL